MEGSEDTFAFIRPGPQVVDHGVPIHQGVDELMGVLRVQPLPLAVEARLAARGLRHLEVQRDLAPVVSVGLKQREQLEFS